LWGNLREIDHLEGPDIDESSGIWRGSVYWIDLAQDRDRFRAYVNTVMNLQVPQNAG
jgi:hypothetical protein